MLANKHAKIMLVLVFAVLGFMLATQIKTTERQKTINVQRAEELTERLRVVEQQRDDLAKEIEKLLLHCAGELAKDRKNRGIKLNFVESTALISSELLELAREGKSVPELMRLGTKILTKEDVMEGVAEVLHEVQIEATFPDGTKLVTVHNPIQ